MLQFRTALLRLEHTTHHLFQPSNECLVPERPTSMHVLPQFSEFLFIDALLRDAGRTVLALFRRFFTWIPAKAGTTNIGRSLLSR